MINEPLALENIATMEMSSRYSVLPYASSGLMNIFLQLAFFPQKWKMYDKSATDFFFYKRVLAVKKTLTLSLKSLSFLT